MMTSGGSERNRLSSKMISQLIGRMARLRSRASTRPASNPLITINTASSMVTTTPDRMSGRYFSITLPLKKVSTKRSHALMERGPPGPHHTCERTRSGCPDLRGTALRLKTLVPLDLADEGASAFLGRLLENRSRRRLLDDQPVIHEHHAIGGRAGKAPLVADHDHGHAGLAQGAHDFEHRADELRIEGAGRLVEQHYPWLERDRARDGDPLLLAARELARRVVGAIGQPDPFQRGAAQSVGLGARLARHLAQGERHVAKRRHVRIEVEVLEHHADPLAGMVDVGSRIEHVDAVDRHRAGARFFQPVETAQQRRLAPARGPDDEHQLALGHFQVDALQDMKGAEMLVNRAGVDDRFHWSTDLQVRIMSMSGPGGPRPGKTTSSAMQLLRRPIVARHPGPP